MAIPTVKVERIRNSIGAISGRQREKHVKIYALLLSFCAILGMDTLAGCTGASSKSPDVSETIRKSLDQANLKDVTVSQDRDKGVVTLGGHVGLDADKLASRIHS